MFQEELGNEGKSVGAPHLRARRWEGQFRTDGCGTAGCRSSRARQTTGQISQLDLNPSRTRRRISQMRAVSGLVGVTVISKISRLSGPEFHRVGHSNARHPDNLSGRGHQGEVGSEPAGNFRIHQEILEFFGTRGALGPEAVPGPPTARRQGQGDPGRIQPGRLRGRPGVAGPAGATRHLPAPAGGGINRSRAIRQAGWLPGAGPAGRP